MSEVIYMRGKEWWLSKTGRGKTRREHYPDAILVGKLGKERRYVPERTCEDVSTLHGRFECGSCGLVIADTSVVSNGGVNYCPDCGAAVEL